METTTIRILTVQDWQEWKNLRLHGAQSNPNAFDNTYDELWSKDRSWYEQQLTVNTIFGAFLEGQEQQLIGCIGFAPGIIEKQKHRGEIFSVYLKPESRGLGIGKLLFQRVIQHVKESHPEIIQLHLSVGALNLPAVRLYESIGFVIYGTEPRRLIGWSKEVDGLQYIDEHLMWLKLR